MPTGYTAAVQSGDITDLRTFALRCARAFGACVTMRDAPHDTPVPSRFEPRTQHYDDLIEECLGKMRQLQAMSADEIDVAAAAAYEDRLNKWTASRDKRAADRGRYEAMLSKVEAWHPPADVVPLKNFMREQLLQSLQFDCGDWLSEPPQQQSGPRWLTACIVELERSIAVATMHRAEEIERVAERNLWLDALRCSLA